MKKICLMIVFLSSFVINKTALAINEEITCSSDVPQGSHCWKCGANCYATLTGTTMNITGSGALDATTQLTNPKYLTSSTWSAYDVKTVNIGKDITSIGNWAFEGMDSIHQINFEKGSKIKSIGQSAFAAAKVDSLMLPETITNLGLWALHRVENIYCTAAQMNSFCNRSLYLNDTNWSPFRKAVENNSIKKYEKHEDGSYTLYGVEGKKIATYDKNGKRIEKRIYTIEEASALVKNNKNTFKLKYR